MSLTCELGKEAVAEQVHSLTDHLVEELGRIGVRIVTEVDRAHRAGIVAFDLGSVDRNQKLAKALESKKIVVSVRYSAGVGGVRVCCHFYNSLEDIDRLIEAIQTSVA